MPDPINLGTNPAYGRAPTTAEAAAARARLAAQQVADNSTTVVVVAAGTAAENGAALVAGLATLAAKSPAPSNSNPCQLMVTPGSYSLAATLDLSAYPGVALVGTTGNPVDVRIYSALSTQTVKAGLSSTIRAVSIGHTGTGVAVNASYNDRTTAVALRVVAANSVTNGTCLDNVILYGNDGRIFGRSALYPLTGTYRRVYAMTAPVNGAGNENWRPFVHGMEVSTYCRFEDCVAGSSSFGSLMAGGWNYGTYVRCRAASNSFGYEMHVGGVFEYCQGDNFCFGSSTSEVAAYTQVSAKFTHCVGSIGFLSGNGDFSGMAIDCRAGDTSFTRVTAQAAFLRCVAGNSSFTNCVDENTIYEDCRAGDYSFTCSGSLYGTFRGCTARSSSFNAGASTASSGAMYAKFYNCTATNDSFSLVANGLMLGEFHNCRATDHSFTTTNTASTMNARCFNCVATDYSFGHYGVANKALFVNCTAGTGSFAGEYANYGFNGTAIDCTASNNSFGYYGGIAAGAKLVRCRAGSQSFGAAGSIYGVLEDCEADADCFGAFGLVNGILRRCKSRDKTFARAGHLSGRIEQCVLQLPIYGGPNTVSALFVECELNFDLSSHLPSNAATFPTVIDSYDDPVSLMRMDRCLVNADLHMVDGILHPEYNVLSDLDSMANIDMHDCRAVGTTIYHKQADVGPASAERVRMNNGDLSNNSSSYYY